MGEHIPFSTIVVICSTIGVTMVTLMAQAMNAMVKASDFAGLKSKVDRLEQSHQIYSTLQNDITHIMDTLKDIKDELKLKQNRE